MTFEHIEKKHGIIVNDTTNCYNQRIRIGLKENKTYIIKACMNKHKKGIKNNVGLLKKEINLLKEFDHPNIIKLIHYDVICDVPYVILPCYQMGDMFDFIQRPKIDTKIIIGICKKVAIAIQYLHKKHNIIHRDIKLDNVVLTNDLEPILIDFEFAVLYKKDMNFRICGSPEYASPEMLKGHAYDFKTDIWSFGVMLYISMFKTYPYPYKKFSFDNACNYFNSNCLRKIKYYRPIDKPIKYVIQSILVEDPKLRLDWDAIIQFL